jgi:hypothetical protein
MKKNGLDDDRKDKWTRMGLDLNRVISDKV